MTSSIALGRYIPGDSAIHRMDSRFKLLMFLFLVGCVFAPQQFTGFFFLTLVIAVLFLVSHLRFNILWRLIRGPILLIFATLWLINCFLIHPKYGEGWTWGQSVFIISEKGLSQAGYISLRILLMMTLSIVLTSTTKPLALTLALEWLLSPLKLIRIPVHIIALIMAIALRMVPTLVDEASKIINAQASRGVDFRNGRIRDKMKAIISLIIPLLVSSFQKAEDLAYAMDTRGYDPHRKRTRYRQFVFSFMDLIIFLFFTGLGIMVAVNTTHPFLIDGFPGWFCFLQHIDGLLGE